MRAAVTSAEGRLVVDEVPSPVPTGEQALIRVEACGVCGSDRHVLEQGILGEGGIPGHEPAGVIEGWAEGAEARLPVGTPVAVKPLVPCGKCRRCRRGQPELCADALRGLGLSADKPGALAELMACEPGQLVELPSERDAALGALAQPLGVAFHATHRSGAEPSEKVAVLGAGGMGVLVALALAARGFDDVTVLQREGPRADAASGLGLRVEPFDAFHELRPDVVFECTGAEEIYKRAIDEIAPGGTLVTVGLVLKAELIPAVLNWKEITLHGTYSYGTSYEEALEALLAGRLPTDELIDRVPLAEAPAAIAALGSEDAPFKTIVEPQR